MDEPKTVGKHLFFLAPGSFLPQTSSRFFPKLQEARQEPAWPDILPIYLKKKAGFPGFLVKLFLGCTYCSYVFVFLGAEATPESYGKWLSNATPITNLVMDARFL